jgi:hypothetical protein
MRVRGDRQRRAVRRQLRERDWMVHDDDSCCGGRHQRERPIGVVDVREMS